jgi:tetratricopeptide (TPR) repeat protein
MVQDPAWCSFCGRTRKETRGMVPGPGVSICSECIALCVELSNERERQPARVMAMEPSPKRREQARDLAQLDRAIGELRALIEADPGDIRSRLKLCDLYAKRNDENETVTHYEHVACHYALEGMPLKAIAVYKQVLKLSVPPPRGIYSKLGELYERLGLWSDARSSFEEEARASERAGDAPAAANAWREKAARLHDSKMEREVREQSGLFCSFCSKSQHAVKKLIAGPTVYICNECVVASAAILAKG